MKRFGVNPSYRHKYVNGLSTQILDPDCLIQKDQTKEVVVDFAFNKQNQNIFKRKKNSVDTKLNPNNQIERQSKLEGPKMDKRHLVLPSVIESHSSVISKLGMFEVDHTPPESIFDSSLNKKTREFFK